MGHHLQRNCNNVTCTDSRKKITSLGKYQKEKVESEDLNKSLRSILWRFHSSVSSASRLA